MDHWAKWVGISDAESLRSLTAGDLATLRDAARVLSRFHGVSSAQFARSVRLSNPRPAAVVLVRRPRPRPSPAAARPPDPRARAKRSRGAKKSRGRTMTYPKRRRRRRPSPRGSSPEPAVGLEPEPLVAEEGGKAGELEEDVDVTTWSILPHGGEADDGGRGATGPLVAWHRADGSTYYDASVRYDSVLRAGDQGLLFLVRRAGVAYVLKWIAGRAGVREREAYQSLLPSRGVLPMSGYREGELAVEDIFEGVRDDPDAAAAIVADVRARIAADRSMLRFNGTQRRFAAQAASTVLLLQRMDGSIDQLDELASLAGRRETVVRVIQRLELRPVILNHIEPVFRLLHQMELEHGDAHPRNILFRKLVDGSWEFAVGDFGSCRPGLGAPLEFSKIGVALHAESSALR